MKAFPIPLIFSISIQTLFYGILTVQAGNHYWKDIAQVIILLALVPVFSAVILAAFRRHASPIIASAAVTGAVFAVAVSVLAASRTQVSYSGILGCLLIVLSAMAYANIKFHRALSTNVAIAPFAKLEQIIGEFHGVRVLEGPDADLSDVEILLIDPIEHHSEKWSHLLADCYLGGIEIMPWTRFLEIRRGRVDVSSFDISHLSYSPSQLLYARIKRTLDIIGVIASIPIVVPIALIVAAYILVRDGRPVIFVQLRRGYGGRRFRMYKFRTMYKGMEGAPTRYADKRIIPGARLIRKYRIDEIPQLYNILCSDMSLVGPRPIAEYETKTTIAVEPKYRFRSLVLPGITGWAQVQSGYGSTIEERIDNFSYDLYYIKNMSFDIDLLILIKTIRVVLLGTGAR